MGLFTNKIHLGKTRTAQEIINSILNKDTVKTSSSKDITKTASKKKEEKSSGQQEVEPLHQEGESTSKVGKKKEGKKSSSKTTKCEQKSSGQLDVEPLHQEGESTPKVGKKKEASISTNGKFVKISNLNKEQEDYLRKYYSMYYPTEFVDALLTKK